MKKYILFFILLFTTNISISFAEGLLVNNIAENFEKNTISNVEKNSNLYFQIESINLNSGINTVRVVFPSGFEYISDSVEFCPTYNIAHTGSTEFSYTYNGSGPCTVLFSYKINTTGTGIIVKPYFNGNNQGIYNVTIDTLPEDKISLTKAETIDSDSNGFLDQIKLFFSDIVSNFNSIGLTIGGYTGSLNSISGNTTIINIIGNVFNTGIKPLISHTGNIFDNVSSFSNFQTTDKSSPVLLKINNNDLNSDITIGSKTLDFTFSEPLSTNTGAYEIQTSSGNKISGNFSISSDTLTFTATSNFTSGSYKIISDGTSSDWNSNTFTLNNTFNLISTVDTQSPIGVKIGTGTGILINDGANQTRFTNIQLSLNATDNIGVTKMIISTNNIFSGSTWENYTTNKEILISNSNGEKSVYVKFRDATGNESIVYSDTIIYNTDNSYLTFDNIDSIYTNTSTITLSGGCNNIDTSITTINYSVGSNTGNFQCNNTTKKWNNTFTITSNTQNIIKIWYGENYDISDIKNSITITNPIEKTINHKETYSNREYSFDSFLLKYGYPQTKTSQNKEITNGYYTLQALFTLDSNGESYTVTNITETLYCNSGYKISGVNCIKKGSGGGGGTGGGSSSSTKTSTGSNTTTNTNTTTQNNVTSQGLLDYAKIINNTLSNDVIVTKDIANNYLQANYGNYSAISKYFNDKTFIENIDLFVSLDNNIKSVYNEYLTSYVGIIENLDSYVKTKNVANKQNVQINTTNLFAKYEILKTVENKYISRASGKYKNIYKTQDPSSQAGLNGFENMVINKLNSLYESKKITPQTYFKSIDDYNMFILHFSIFRITGNTDSKAKALEFGKSFLQIYYTK